MGLLMPIHPITELVDAIPSDDRDAVGWECCVQFPAGLRGGRVAAPLTPAGCFTCRPEYCKITEPTGDVAQLGEHCLCKAGVAGSIPVVSSSLEISEFHQVTQPHSPRVRG